MLNFVIHLARLSMTMDIRNISTADTENQHTFAVSVLVNLRPMLCPTVKQTIDNDQLVGTSAHVAEFQVLIPVMKKMDILTMINAASGTMVAVVILYSFVYVIDVSDDWAAIVVSLKFLVCDVADICSQDVLSYAMPCDSIGKDNTT